MADSKQSFQWTGINNQGKRIDGVVQAMDLKDAQSELSRMGIEVIQLQAKSGFNLNLGGLSRRGKKLNLRIFSCSRAISLLC